MSVLIVLTNNVSAAAQTSDIVREAGDITGQVSYCGQVAQDMTVYIRGTSYTSMTDGNGSYRLSYVQQGTYDLVVKNNGLTLGTIPQVSVIQKQVTSTGNTDFCSDLDNDGYNPPLDCNDSNPNINPGVIETCGDGIDNNCNLSIDEGCQVCTDNDLDSFFGQPGCGTPVDCSDNDPAVNPLAIEVCDSVDNNCDGNIDEAGAIGQTNFYLDADSDGFGDPITAVQACGAPAGYISTGGDCDDGNPSVYPGAIEIADGVDNDCNGMIDDGI